MGGGDTGTAGHVTGKREHTTSRNQLPFNSFFWGKGCSGTRLISAFYTSRSRDETYWDCYLLMTMANYPNANTDTRQSSARPSPSPPGLVLALRWQERFLLTACFQQGIPLGSSGQSGSLESWFWGCCRLPSHGSMTLGMGNTSLCSITCCMWLQPTSCPRHTPTGCPCRSPRPLAMT